MSKSQREKGSRFERAVNNDLEDRTGLEIGRNIGQARDGGEDITLERLRIECKARAAIAVYEFVDQVVNEATADQVPIVVAKGDYRRWLVIAQYDDVIEALLRDTVLCRCGAAQVESSTRSPWCGNCGHRRSPDESKG